MGIDDQDRVFEHNHAGICGGEMPRWREHRIDAFRHHLESELLGYGDCGDTESGRKSEHGLHVLRSLAVDRVETGGDNDGDA